MFKVNRLIVHAVEKTAAEVKIQKSNSLTAVNPDYYTSLEKFVKSFSNDGITHAIFDEADPSDVKTHFQEFANSGKENADFINFSKSSVDSIAEFLKPTNSVGGFFFFCEYELEDQELLSILLVRKTENMDIKFDESTKSFQIRSMTIPDTQNIAMGCEISYSKFAKAQTYLRLTNKRSAEVSDYFKKWIGIDNKGSSADYTNAFYDLIDKVSDDPKIEPSSNLKAKLFGLLSVQKEKIADLQAIGSQIFDDKMFLVERAKTLNIEIDSRFQLNSKAFRKRNFIETKDADGIKLSFPRHLYGSNQPIEVRGEGSERVLVIESQDLIDDILKKL